MIDTNPTGVILHPKATITFNNRSDAKEFIKQWTHFTLCGSNLSTNTETGLTEVAVFEIDQCRKDWIDSFQQDRNNLS